MFCHHYSRTLRRHRFQRTTREVTRIADSNLAIDDLTRSVRRISSLFRQTRYGKARHTRRRPALPSRSSNHRPARYHLSLQKRLSVLVSSVFEDILAPKIARLSRCIELFFYRRFLIDRTEASTISLFHTSWQEALSARPAQTMHFQPLLRPQLFSWNISSLRWRHQRYLRRLRLVRQLPKLRYFCASLSLRLPALVSTLPVRRHRTRQEFENRRRRRRHRCCHRVLSLSLPLSFLLLHSLFLAYPVFLLLLLQPPAFLRTPYLPPPILSRQS